MPSAPCELRWVTGVAVSLPTLVFGMADRPPLPESAVQLPPLGGEFRAAVAGFATGLGLSLDPAQMDAIEAHARLLLAWNQHINLTAIRDPDAVARLHVADSLSRRARSGRPSQPRDARPRPGERRWLPGAALAVTLPVGEVGLLDFGGQEGAVPGGGAREPSLAALGARAPRISAIRARSEQRAHARDDREAWDVVVVRAVGSLAEIVELGLPLLRVGGELLALEARRPGVATGPRRRDRERPPAHPFDWRTARCGRRRAARGAERPCPGADRQGPSVAESLSARPGAPSHQLKRRSALTRACPDRLGRDADPGPDGHPLEPLCPRFRPCRGRRG